MVKTKHIFQLSRIIDKMGLKEDLKMIVSNKKKKVDSEALGYDILMALASKIHLAEKDTMDLLADVSGKTSKAIEDQSPKETFEMIKTLLSEEGVLDFLSSIQAD